jgi:hypothetical protein
VKDNIQSRTRNPQPGMHWAWPLTLERVVVPDFRKSDRHRKTSGSHSDVDLTGVESGMMTARGWESGGRRGMGKG